MTGETNARTAQEGTKSGAQAVSENSLGEQRRAMHVADSGSSMYRGQRGQKILHVIQRGINNRTQQYVMAHSPLS